jgi:hypothetical protein
MRQVMVRYKVKSDRVAENEGYIREVFEQLHRERPAGIQYASFKLADGASFVHVAFVDDSAGGNPLTSLQTFQAFSAGIAERCEEAPVTTHLTMVGSYEAM